MDMPTYNSIFIPILSLRGDYIKYRAILAIILLFVVTQVRAQSEQETEDISAVVITMQGETIKDAVLKCGPFGWSSYIQRAHYSRRLDDLTSGTVPDRTIIFQKIARMDFMEMNEAEWKILGTSQFRETILKAKITFRDGTIWTPVYIVSYCYLETPYENANFNKLKPKQIVFKHKKK